MTFHQMSDHPTNGGFSTEQDILFLSSVPLDSSTADAPGVPLSRDPKPSVETLTRTTSHTDRSMNASSWDDRACRSATAAPAESACPITGTLDSDFANRPTDDGIAVVRYNPRLARVRAEFKLCEVAAPGAAINHRTDEQPVQRDESK